MRWAAPAFAIIAASAAVFQGSPRDAVACIRIHPPANERVTRDLVRFETLAIAQVLTAESWIEPGSPISRDELLASGRSDLALPKQHMRLELQIIEEFKGNGARRMFATGRWLDLRGACGIALPPPTAGDTIFVALNHNSDGTISIGGDESFPVPVPEDQPLPDRASYLTILRNQAPPREPDGGKFLGYPRGEAASGLWISAYFAASVVLLFGLSVVRVRRASAVRLPR